MKIHYTPEGRPGREYRFIPGKLLSTYGEMIEEVGGRTWATYTDWEALFLAGHRKAWRAALWVSILQHDDPELQFDDLVIQMGELLITYEPEELERLQQAVADSLAEDADDPQAVAIREQIEAQTEYEHLDPKASPGFDEPSGSTSAEPVLPQA